MRYTVLWEPSAEAELAQIWLDAADRRAVQEAADRIDSTLRMNPENEAR
jgi:hypothetical protein